MTPIPPDAIHDAAVLGRLAMQFRGTRNESDRREIARCYAEAVERLIAGGDWTEMPAFEDQLPDDRMPEAFFDYWAPRPERS